MRLRLWLSVEAMCPRALSNLDISIAQLGGGRIPCPHLCNSETCRQTSPWSLGTFRLGRQIQMASPLWCIQGAQSACAVHLLNICQRCSRRLNLPGSNFSPFYFRSSRNGISAAKAKARIGAKDAQSAIAHLRENLKTIKRPIVSRSDFSEAASLIPAVPSAVASILKVCRRKRD